MVTVGMFLLVVWRVVEAAFGHDDAHGSDLWKARAVSALKALLYAVLGVSAFKVATGSSGGGGNGLVLIWRGWSEKFREHLDAEGQSGETGSAYLLLGKIGYIAKGLALVVVGGLFGYAALTHDPNKSGGLDEALREVLRQPFGSVMLIGIGLGFACYGLFCFARARHLKR